VEGYTFFHPSTSWLQNFPTTDEGYNMLLRLRVFIHWEEGFTIFHLSTSWLCDFSFTEKRVTASVSVHSLWQGDVVQNCSNTLHNVLHDSAKKVCQDANNRTLYSRKAAISTFGVSVGMTNWLW
jgi:hypothetical protein